MNFIKKIINFIKLFIQKRKKRKINKLNNKIQKLNKGQPMGLSYVDLRQETNVLDVDLVDDNASETDKKRVRQYSKCAVTAILILAAIWISWSYILSTYCVVVLGTIEVLQELSKDVCNSIIFVMLGYFLKAYFESFSAANHDLEIKKFNIEENQEFNSNDDIESVG